MKLNTVGNYLFITITSVDWRMGIGKRLQAELIDTPGSIRIGSDWKIPLSQKWRIKEFLPPFSDEEELEGEIEFKAFLDQFSDSKYTL